MLVVVVALGVGGWVLLGGWHPWRGNVAPSFEAASTRTCNGDSAGWIAALRVDGATVAVTQTDVGARAGSDDPAAFAALVVNCMVQLGGDRTEIEEYRAQLQCEVWLHNLATVARNGDTERGAALRQVPGLDGLLDRGRPIDMNADVWAGNTRGRPWDGRVSVCTAVERALR